MLGISQLCLIYKHKAVFSKSVINVLIHHLSFPLPLSPAFTWTVAGTWYPWSPPEISLPRCLGVPVKKREGFLYSCLCHLAPWPSLEIPFPRNWFFSQVTTSSSSPSFPAARLACLVHTFSHQHPWVAPLALFSGWTLYHLAAASPLMSSPKPVILHP